VSAPNGSALPPAGRLRAPGAAFLLSQVGYHTSKLWQQRLAALDMDPRHVVLLRLIAAEEGRSQQALGKQMRIPASRVVALVDDLERRGFLERRRSPADRRAWALFLTAEGRAALGRVMAVSADHEDRICAGLTGDERAQLITLLGRIAANQGLVEGVHPGVDSDSPEG
jgi:DNA-binding MarR family transcriptional regulator